MKNYLDILHEINSKLLVDGYENERKELEEAIREGSTSGEIMSHCGYKLLEFKRQNEKIHIHLKNLISEFVAFCNFNNIYLKNQY
jgi:hypothetical protein